MPRQSTRMKLKNAVKKAITAVDRSFENLYTTEVLGEGKHETVDNYLATVLSIGAGYRAILEKYMNAF